MEEPCTRLPGFSNTPETLVQVWSLDLTSHKSACAHTTPSPRSRIQRTQFLCVMHGHEGYGEGTTCMRSSLQEEQEQEVTLNISADEERRPYLMSNGIELSRV